MRALQVQLAEFMHHGGATHSVATLATPATALATPATAAHESGLGAAQTGHVATDSGSVPAEAVLPEGTTATLPGEPVIATAELIPGVALLLDTAAGPVITLVPFQKAVDQSPCVAMADSTGVGLLPSASGLTYWQYTMAVSPLKCRTALVL